jgi:tRNA modification GTPase
MLIRSSIQEADVSLCVLSLPEVLSETEPGIRMPASVLPLLSSTTLFLLNKADLVSSPDATVLPLSWTVSLCTGEGTAEFLASFAKTLHQRSVFKSLYVCLHNTAVQIRSPR